jgi:hypothetical protein
VRLALALAVVTLACPAVASAQTVSIGASPAPAKYDRVVTFSGALAPAQGGLQVELYLTVPSPHVVGTGTTAADGSWSIATHLRAPRGADRDRLRACDRRAGERDDRECEGEPHGGIVCTMVG